MKKLCYLALAAIALAVVLSGCGGHKVEGVPGNVAIVNGNDVTGNAYLEELHRKQGEQMLRTLIEREILMDWARSLKAGVTDEQIQKSYDMLKEEGQYDDLYKQLGDQVLKSEMSQRQARINIGQKLFKFTDKDLEQVYNEPYIKGRFVHGPRKMVAIIINPKKEQVDKARKKITDGMDFDEASGEFTDRRMAPRGTIKTWIDPEQKELPAPLVAELKKTKEGQVSKVFALGMPGMPTNYALLKVLRTQGKSDKKLSQVREQVLSEASWRKTMTDPEFDKKFRERKKKAKIEVEVPEFRGVIQDFKNPPEMMPGFGMQPGMGPQ